MRSALRLLAGMRLLRGSALSQAADNRRRIRHAGGISRPIVAGLAPCLLFALSPAARPADTPARAHSPQRPPPTVESPRLPQLEKRVPANVDDLRAIESQVLKVTDGIRASTVSVIAGESQGSGVIVTEDGLVLTAAHVVAIPGRKVTVILSDGRRVAGRALGLNTGSDSAIVRITEPGTYASSKISDLRTEKVGHWCLGTGHPGGFQSGRTPVVRLGRIVGMREGFVQTDCPLLGGDSGGPLFDLNGNVIGIHSRIGPRTSLNLHVSAALFVRDWDRLIRVPEAEQSTTSSPGMLGVNGEDDPRGARLTTVFPRLPAAQAGLRPGDVVTRISGRPISRFAELQQTVQARRAGETVELRVLRGNGPLDVRATLVARPME